MRISYGLLHIKWFYYSYIMLIFSIIYILRSIQVINWINFNLSTLNLQITFSLSINPNTIHNFFSICTYNVHIPLFRTPYTQYTLKILLHIRKLKCSLPLEPIENTGFYAIQKCVLCFFLPDIFIAFSPFFLSAILFRKYLCCIIAYTSKAWKLQRPLFSHYKTPP